MKKATALLLTMIIACSVLAGCSHEINHGDRNIMYNGIVYERCDDMNFNLQFYEDNSWYIGDFIEIYAYGQEIPWPIHALNKEENALYSSHATWIKPGYSLPDNFGEELSAIEYVVSSGIDFMIMEDEYTDEATLLITFDKVVMLEDIIEVEPSEIEGYVEYDEIRVSYTHHADMASLYAISSLDGKYYLNVRQGEYGTDEWHEIKAEYVDLLTSNIASSN